MNGIRISRTVLLSIALLITGLALVMPVAHSIVIFGSDTTTETTVEEVYTLWGVETTVEGARDTGHSPQDVSWSDESLDNTGGITYLRYAPFLVVIGAVLALTALIITVVPATGETRVGGVLSALGFLGLLLGVILHGAGLTLRNDDIFVRAWIPEAVLVGYLVAFALLALLIAALLGMTTTRVVTRDTTGSTDEATAQAWDDPTAETWTETSSESWNEPATDTWDDANWDTPVVAEATHADHTNLRYFKCNGCGSVASVTGQAQPVCAGCGNQAAAF